MKALVVVDSVYDCTKSVGEAIADELQKEGHEVVTFVLKEAKPSALDGDYLFLGCPTRFGKPTRKMRKFIDAQDWRSFTGVAVVFDTIMQLPAGDPKRAKYVDNGSAPTIKNELMQKGVRVYNEVFRAEVAGLKGPLVDTALEDARQFVHELL